MYGREEPILVPFFPPSPSLMEIPSNLPSSILPLWTPKTLHYLAFSITQSNLKALIFFLNLNYSFTFFVFTRGVPEFSGTGVQKPLCYFKIDLNYFNVLTIYCEVVRLG